MTLFKSEHIKTNEKYDESDFVFDLKKKSGKIKLAHKAYRNNITQRKEKRSDEAVWQTLLNDRQWFGEITQRR